MYLNNIIIDTEGENQEELAELIEGIEFLCSTPTGKFPMNREFGISQDLQDQPIETVKDLLSIELKEKIERYEPRVEVSDVSYDYDPDTGGLTPIISVDLLELSDDDWEEDEYDEDAEDEDDV